MTDPWVTLALPVHRNLHNDIADLAHDLNISVEACCRMLLSRGVIATRGQQ